MSKLHVNEILVMRYGETFDSLSIEGRKDDERLLEAIHTLYMDKDHSRQKLRMLRDDERDHNRAHWRAFNRAVISMSRQGASSERWHCFR